ncbi:MAG TPA: cupin domain-containing protein [Vicinamibacterales bacterium]|nr:cupin domain-containing protein [Vicinamibacterales bacterium]
MLSATLTEGLERYEIGPKLRVLRLKKKMGLVELGKHTALSAALLSKIERGRLFPTLPTLLRISLVFGVGLEYFFTEARDKPTIAVVRKADRVRFPERPEGRSSYSFECLDYPAPERKMNAYLVEFEPVEAGSVPPHSHSGAEVLYVLQGQMAVTYEGVDHELKAGDSMYFDSGRPHAYTSTGRTPTSAVVVTTA